MKILAGQGSVVPPRENLMGLQTFFFDLTWEMQSAPGVRIGSVQGCLTTHPVISVSVANAAIRIYTEDYVRTVAAYFSHHLPPELQGILQSTVWIG